MGYYSDYTGSYHPSKPIPSEVVKEINDLDLDLSVKTNADDWNRDGLVGDVCAWGYNMKGYYFKENLLKIVRLLAKHGINLSGEVERVGEEQGDYELIIARDGKVFAAMGEIKYGKEMEFTDEEE